MVAGGEELAISGLDWKRSAAETLERRRRFLRREMQDSILCTLPVALDCEHQWRQFERKWGTYAEGEERPYPSNEEILDRLLIGLAERGKVEDDWLPVLYSTLDAGEGIAGALMGARSIRFLHRRRGPTFSKAETVLPDYAGLGSLRFSLDNPWARRLLSFQEHFERRAGSCFAQHPFLTMDAMNFACELREASNAYLDVYEHPAELRRLMEIGLDFNVRFQQAQMDVIGPYQDGCFVWLAGWAPFERAVSMSVDAHVICSVKTYAEFGFEYNQRLIDHFGHGLMHFHCNRADLAAEVARLRGLELFQFGGDSRDGVSSMDRLPEIRRAVGDIPIMVDCELKEFCERLARRRLPGNVWYGVTTAEPLPVDEANRLAGKVRAYRA